MHIFTEAPVLPEPNSPISIAARELAEAKVHLDVLSRTAGGRLLVRQILQCGKGEPPVAPTSFAGAVLPFFSSQRSKCESGPGYKAMVPSAIVLGWSWRWHPDNLDDALKKKVVSVAFDRFARSTGVRVVKDCAHYHLIKPLGLVLAHEGKNRVALFRALDLPYIPAVVHDDGYPAADRMRIYEIGDEVFAVLDERHVERFRAVELGRGLLAAYGVLFEKKWPDGYPALDRVRAAFDDMRLVGRIGTPTVDLARLALDEAVDRTEVKVALADVAGIRWPGPKRLLVGAALLPALVVATALAKPYPTVTNVLVCMLGALVAVFSLPFVGAVQCRVQDLRERARWTQGREVRQRLASSESRRQADLDGAGGR